MKNIPNWNPNLIQDCGQFEDALAAVTDKIDLPAHFVTNLRRSWAIGEDLRLHNGLRNHKVESEITIPFAGGAFSITALAGYALRTTGNFTSMVAPR